MVLKASWDPWSPKFKILEFQLALDTHVSQKIKEVMLQNCEQFMDKNMYKIKVYQTTTNLADPSMENPNQIQTQNHTHQYCENPTTPPWKPSLVPKSRIINFRTTTKIMTINLAPPLANKFANPHPPPPQHCLYNPSLKSLVALLKSP